MGLLTNHSMINNVTGNIQYIGSANTPADNAFNNATPCAVIPPAGMQAGDLVFVVTSDRSNGSFTVVSQAGGQTWDSSLTATYIANVYSKPYWCIFNGTWSANPSWHWNSGSTSTPLSVQMHVFRPTQGKTFNFSFQSGVTSDNTNPCEIPSYTPFYKSSLAIAFWNTTNATEFIHIANNGWLQLGLAQYRNLGGSDQTQAYSYKIQYPIAPLFVASKNKMVGAFGHDYVTIFHET